eukprot:9096493-Pyramimonas_sp.AAC.1
MRPGWSKMPRKAVSRRLHDVQMAPRGPTMALLCPQVGRRWTHDNPIWPQDGPRNPRFATSGLQEEIQESLKKNKITDRSWVFE